MLCLRNLLFFITWVAPPPLWTMLKKTARLVHWGISYSATRCDQAFDIASCLLFLSKKFTKYAWSKLDFGFRSKIFVVSKWKSSKLNGNVQGLRTWTKRKGTRGFDLPLRGILSGMLFWALDYGTAGWWEDIAAQAPHVNGQLGKSKTTPCRRVNRRLVSGNVRLCEEHHSASDSWDCRLNLHFFWQTLNFLFALGFRLNFSFLHHKIVPYVTFSTSYPFQNM